jgi:hypothetical protein
LVLFLLDLSLLPLPTAALVLLTLPLLLPLRPLLGLLPPSGPPPPHHCAPTHGIWKSSSTAAALLLDRRVRSGFHPEVLPLMARRVPQLPAPGQKAQVFASTSSRTAEQARAVSLITRSGLMPLHVRDGMLGSLIPNTGALLVCGSTTGNHVIRLTRFAC